MGMSANSVCTIIKKVTKAILETFIHMIDWPVEEYECRRIAARFSQLARPYGMPQLAGALDVTLIDIVAPADSGGVFIGRNRRTALNVLGVTDGRNKFLFISARFPASVDDQRVLRKTLGVRFDGGYRPFKNCILLGDSAYKATDWLVPMKEIQACIKDAPGYETQCHPERKATKCCQGTCTAASGWKCVGGLEEEKAENITEM
uniref:DDE Tnp4 domain-containing protein n=1 Tax=Meloidogyne javanica TaxID=6303 RepID=A0A915LFI4_MELJA